MRKCLGKGGQTELSCGMNRNSGTVIAHSANGRSIGTGELSWTKSPSYL